MIVYDKLWIALKDKGISQNRLYKYYNISRAQIYRLKHSAAKGCNQTKKNHPFVDARAIMHLITGIKVPFSIGN